MTYTVTNLNDSGEGSLRYAVTSGTGDISFNVGGEINLGGTLNITSGNRTINGESAPDPGITIKGYPVRISSGGDNLHLKYIRIMSSDLNVSSGNGFPSQGNADLSPTEANTIEIRNVSGITLEHCSLYWSVDEALDVYDADVIVKDCIISQPLNNNRNSSNGGQHSFSVFVSTHQSNQTDRTLKFYNNLICHSLARNISFSANHSGSGALSLDIQGNIFYNTGTHATHSQYLGENVIGTFNFVKNQYINGPDTNWNSFAWYAVSGIPLYQSGNKLVTSSGTFDLWEVEPLLNGQVTTDYVNLSPDTVKSRHIVYDFAGCSNYRNWNDSVSVEQANKMTGSIIDTARIQDEGSNNTVNTISTEASGIKTFYDSVGVISRWKFDRFSRDFRDILIDEKNNTNLDFRGTY